jgi:hypothetical protein
MIVVVVLQEVVEGEEGIGMADGRGTVVLEVQGRGNEEVVQVRMHLHNIFIMSMLI